MTTTNIQQFDFRENHIRTVEENGNVLFCAKDVAEALGYKDTVNAIKQHCRGVAFRHPIVDSLGRTQDARFISEGDVYRLIASSKLPQAVEFEHWLFDEVVPSIRKHGGYMSGQEQLTPEQLVLKSMQYLQSKIDEQRLQLEAQAPKVLFADAYSASDKCILVGELAKILTQNGYQTGQNRLFKQFQQEGYLMKKNGNPHFPTQKSMELGLFEVKTTIITHSNGKEKPSFTTKVTPKGQAYFIRRYLRTQQLDLEA